MRGWEAAAIVLAVLACDAASKEPPLDRPARATGRGGEPGAAESTLAAIPAPARCRSAQLLARLAKSDASEVMRAIDIQLVNTGRTRCTMRGYPDLALLDAVGRALPGVRIEQRAGTSFVDSLPVATIALAPGRAAWFQVESRAPARRPPQRCPRADSLAVTPPDEAVALRVAARVDACGGTVTVTPVRDGLPPP